MTLTAQRDEPAAPAPGDTTHWRAAVLLAIALHAAVAGALFARPAAPPPAEDGGAPVIVIELAVVAAAPEAAPADLAPGPTAESAAETPPPLEPPPAAEVTPPDPPPEPPAETPPAETIEPPPQPEKPPEPEKPIDPDGIPEPDRPPPPPPPPPPPAAEEPPAATAPPSAAQPAPKPAAAAPGSVAQVPPAVVTRWQTLLLAELNRKKRYPAAARGRAGTARVAFTIDHDGRVVSRSIATSSGSPALDAEALALLDRASPLPVPPAELAAAALSFVVPIRFTAASGASSGGRSNP